MTPSITKLIATLAIATLAMACHRGDTPYTYADLQPQSATPDAPIRQKPSALALHPDRAELYVALPGTPDRPGRTVAVIDLHAREVIARHTVGSGPTALALHPGGDHLVVANRYSNYLTVLDLQTSRSHRQLYDYYAEGLLFDALGDRLFVANRKRNAVDVLPTRQDHRLTFGARTAEHPVGFNPARMALSPGDETLYVASIAGVAVAAVELAATSSLAMPLTGASPVEDVITDPSPPAYAAWADTPGTHGIWLGAPAFDVLATSTHLYVATLSESTHHRPGTGDDLHPYGQPSRGAPNEGFQALQNELAVFARPHHYPAQRYTSTNYCCPDVLDISPDHPERGHLLPDESLRIVDGALPTALAVHHTDPPTLLVTYGGSNQLQRFEMLPGGELYPGPTIAVGLDPRAVVVDPTTNTAYVANRLSDSIDVVDLESFQVIHTIDVALPHSPPFPATDTERGEALYYAAASLSVDGGKTCNHCHFDRGNLGKFFHMPWLDHLHASRITPDTRGLHDTIPWTLPHLEGFAHPANFDDHAARDRFFQRQTPPLVGEALTAEDVRDLLNLYLQSTPSLLPNPHVDADPAAAERGRLLFESPETGCAFCHPAPTFFHPDTFGPMIDPGPDRALIHSTSLRGLWDRAPGYYHDGRAPTLLQALVPPGHRALPDGADGYNIADGIPDTHGGTSHLSPQELNDLVQYLLTL